MIAMLVLNAIAAGFSVFFAVTAIIRPTALSRSATASEGETLYARMYAVRAIPLGLAAAIVPFFSLDFGTAIVLFVAGAVQLADVFVLGSRRELGRSVGPLLAAGVHLATAILVLVGVTP